MKKSKLVTVLVIIMVVLLLACAGIVGYLWYCNTHVFVEHKAYPVNAEILDLREEDISFDHYNELHALLPDCTILWNVPFQGQLHSSDSETLKVSGLSQEDIGILLDYFPNLQKVDAAGCRDYAALEALKEQKRSLELAYTVSVGSKEITPDTAELVLEPQDYELDTLMENLHHLPGVTSLYLKKADMTLEQMNALIEAYPDVAVSYTVEIMGKEYGTETIELNLSEMTSAEVDSACEKFALLPNLKSVDLMNADGNSSLEKEDVKKLMSQVSDVVFHYTFDFYGETLSTADEEIRVANKKIGDAGEGEVRLALDLLKNCKRFVLENCQISNDVMAKIRDDYREQTKVVWRVYFGVGSTLTDAEVIRAVYDLLDDNSHNLVYCEDVRYMDIGHNEYLDGADFVAGMPNLEVIIISGSPIKDLAPFANCKKLRILEASDCGYINDLTPLASCESLEMLNICYTKVTDLSPLDNLNITNLHARGRYRVLIPQEEQDRFTEKHPDCLSSFIVSDQPYGIGWRYVTENETMDWYKDIQKAFRYPDAPNHVGWYLDK